MEPLVPLERWNCTGGQSPRDQFAGRAMQALIASSYSCDPAFVAERAYEFADAMMRVRDAN